MSIHFSSKIAPEEGSIGINVAFKDETGVAKAPDAGSIKWHLTDLDGNVINSLQDKSETSATNIDILLQGDDLAIQDSEVDIELPVREIAVEWTYSSNLGDNIKQKTIARFQIRNSRYYPTS